MCCTERKRKVGSHPGLGWPSLLPTQYNYRKQRAANIPKSRSKLLSRAMLYSDRYGLATAESQRRYRHRVRVLATGTFCISVLGLALTSRADESRKFSVRPFASHKQRSWIWDLYLLATSFAWVILLFLLFIASCSS